MSKVSKFEMGVVSSIATISLLALVVSLAESLATSRSEVHNLLLPEGTAPYVAAAAAVEYLWVVVYILGPQLFKLVMK